MLLACREKAPHPDVSVACLKSLALLCPLMLESFPQWRPDIRELLSSAVISEELKESGGVLVSRLNKRRKEHSGHLQVRYGWRGRVRRSDLEVQGGVRGLRGADHRGGADGGDERRR